MNDFNKILKKSLLYPKKERYIRTKQEREAIDRMSGSPRRTARNFNQSQPPIQLGSSRPDTRNVFPIISVGSSINSVDYQEVPQNIMNAVP